MQFDKKPIKTNNTKDLISDMKRRIESNNFGQIVQENESTKIK